jgi:hypothetical protein
MLSSEPREANGAKAKGDSDLRTCGTGEHSGTADALPVHDRTLLEEGLTTLNLSKRTLMRGNPGEEEHG